MKHYIKKIKKNYKLLAVALLIGLIIGYGISFVGNSNTSHHEHTEIKEQGGSWTCSMHPQIKQDKPGQCPICGMDLIPVTTMALAGDHVNTNEIALSETAAQLADIQTTVVTKGEAVKSIYLQGKVEADERGVAELTARFGGRIEKLFVNFTGQQVTKGTPLATIYSPELLAAQKELLEAAVTKSSYPALYEAAKRKLKLWDLSDEQIINIETESNPQAFFNVLAPVSGTVTQRRIAIGDYVKMGQPLFTLMDLSKVWIVFNAYEKDLQWIKVGDEVECSIESLPGERFSSLVKFIDPVVNAQKRTVGVRLELNNQNAQLKPEMFVSGKINSHLSKSDALLIPKSSVLWTGKKAVVYVKVIERNTPTFLYREITLGADAGDFYVVANGLSEGEMVVTNGVFKVDAAAQLEGKVSMMNPNQNTNQPENVVKAFTQDKSDVVKTTFIVAGNCEMCQENIEGAAKSVKGVVAVSWSAEAQQLNLKFDASFTNADEVQKAIAGVGYDTEKFKANDSDYTKLAGCCQYKRLNY